MLLGGLGYNTGYYGDTTETVTETEYDGVPGFPLQYITKYGQFQN